MHAIRRIPSLWRNAISTTRNYGKGGHHRAPTVNDMPVPEGDFWALYNKRQRKHNAILATGVISLGFSIFLLNQPGVGFNFYFSPPKSID